MGLSEFQLIERFFVRNARYDGSVDLGIGDDAALISVNPGQSLAVTTDTLVEGVHFFSGANPESLGHKALAVNLSDLAAMGAEPRWASLALTLPQSDPSWLSGFAQGLFELADVWAVRLIGGDTTQGPRSITVHAMGTVPKGDALLRSGARPGDVIYLTGSVGDAGLGLMTERKEAECGDDAVLRRLHRPDPRIAVGLRLRGLATACIDVSDGLAADLGHVLRLSQVGAVIDWHALPLSAAVKAYVDETGDWELPLRCGDDYELCFTVAAADVATLEARLAGLPDPCTRIGSINGSGTLDVVRDSGAMEFPLSGYEHFS